MKKIIIISILSVLSLTGCFLISKDVDEARMKRDMVDIINNENEENFNNEKIDSMYCYTTFFQSFITHRIDSKSITDEELSKNISDELCVIEKEEREREESTYRKDFGDIELPKDWNNGVSGKTTTQKRHRWWT